MSESVVLMDAACCPAANRAAYSACARTSYYARYDGREDVDGAVDSGTVIVVSEEEYSAGDRS